MKRLTSFVRFAPIVAAALGLHAGARAGGPDVGVSVQISQPGVYGRVDIGRFPQPAVVLPQPVIVAPRPMPQPPPGVVLKTPPPAPQPLYMWVPPGHRKNWRKHCARYNACGVPVYFVRDDWYAHQVQPRERWEDRSRGGYGRDRGQDDGRGRRGRGHGHDRD